MQVVTWLLSESAVLSLCE